jgi:hypothetical protein
MAKILTPVNTMLEHYLSMKYLATDFPRLLDRVDVTGAATVNSTILSTQTALNTLIGSQNLSSGSKKLFLTVDGVTDPATDIAVTLKDGSTTIATGTILAHSGIDAIFPMTVSAAFTATPALTVTITGGTAGVVFSIMLVDDSSWMDLGQNFSESISFQDGALGMPVARGWDATAFQKRVRTGNSFSLRQLYCSQFEGIANLRGKTILIKDEVRVDGSATIKETSYYVACSVTGVSQAIGAGGQEQADMVDAGGFYKRGYIWTADATAVTAMM